MDRRQNRGLTRFGSSLPAKSCRDIGLREDWQPCRLSPIVCDIPGAGIPTRSTAAAVDENCPATGPGADRAMWLQERNCRKGVWPVNLEATTRRRFFLGQMFGAAAAAGLSMTAARAAAAEASGADDWIAEVKGTHRCLFDFPQHKNGMPLLHILNYLNTYAAAYKTGPGQVGAVGTFYSAGSQASIPLAFNDAIWAKYQLGVYTGLKDADGKAYTRNVFNRPTTKDLHLLMQAIDSPMIPALADAIPALGIESLQKMGAKFVLCANALGIWCLELEARGKGKAQDIDAELRANLLPGVTIVPAMVIAIEKAQEAGIRYNRQ
jgi:intracellular sulfur oxidation DsrE/DsrF family protein